jgi:hypothetical protein
MKNMRHGGGPGVKKLRPLIMGPFEVDHMVGASAVKMHLLPEWRQIHNVFHVSLTSHFSANRQSHIGLSRPLRLCNG